MTDCAAGGQEDAAFTPLDTCCRSLGTMIRTVSLLLGVALLCGHGAFARRVVSGESGQGYCPSSRRQGIWDSGAVRGNLQQGGNSSESWKTVLSRTTREMVKTFYPFFLSPSLRKPESLSSLFFFEAPSITAKRALAKSEQRSIFSFRHRFPLPLEDREWITGRQGWAPAKGVW